MVVQLRSFMLVCHELGIEDVEVLSLAARKIGGFSVEQWANLSIEEFEYCRSKLTDHEKSELGECLKACQEVLKF